MVFRRGLKLALSTIKWRVKRALLLHRMKACAIEKLGEIDSMGRNSI
jgi:hypothetical protein